MQEKLEGFRLSPQQKQLWYSRQRGEGAEKSLNLLLQLRGTLNRDALQAAFNRLIESHEILRTSFARLDGMNLPLQVVNEAAPFAIGDWSAPATLDPANLASLHNGLARPFLTMLAQEPEPQPLTAQLCALAENEHLLLLRVSVLNGDAAGVDALVQALADLYLAECGAPEPEHEPLQYGDLSEWLHELQVGEDTEEGRTYWAAQNTAAAAAPQLPFRLSEQGTFGVARYHRLLLDGVLLEDLRRLAATRDSSLQTLLFTAWQALTARLSEQNAPQIHTAFDCRKFDELSDALGPLTHFVPMTVELDPGITFDAAWRRHDALWREREQWLEYYRREKPEVAATLGFSFRQTPQPVECGGLRFVHLDETCIAESFLLGLHVLDRGSVLSVDVQFDDAAFTTETAALWARQWLTLLQRIVAQPDARVDQLDLLGEQDRVTLLQQFNQTQQTFAGPEVLAALLRNAGETFAQQTAVVHGEQRLSFGELATRADAWAAVLRAQGIGCDQVVAIYCQPSFEMLVAIWAVVKAGAAYLPLDPAHPEARIAFMLEDAGAVKVLTHGATAAALPPSAPAALLLDEAPPVVAEVPTPLVQPQPDNLVYVIYTSGSSGQPKGTAITHRGLSNYLYWAQNAYAAKDGEGAPLHGSLSFDATVTALFLPMLSGKPVYLPQGGQDAEALGELLSDYAGLNPIKLTPAHLDVLTPRAETEALQPSGGSFVLGGEALFYERLATWRRFFPNARFFNEYGPTETVVGCCVHEVIAPAGSRGAVPIGRPIANTSLYVLDEQGRPVAAGFAGELYIGGAGLARGYVGRPATTAAAFVPDPFSDQPGARLYRTGDRVRFRPDGDLEFLGRIDRQVKLRGYRIEPGEIEVALERLDDIAQAVVLLLGQAERQRLAAFLVARDGVTLDTAEVRRQLPASLPSYMVPARLIAVDTIPLTVNGKVDTQALALFEKEDDPTRDDYRAPRNHTETLLAEWWSTLLGKSRIGIDDNFFRLGGHSLLATQLVSRIRTGFKVAFTLRDLFAAATIAEQAERIQSAVDDALPPPTPLEPAEFYPLSFAQQRLWFLDNLDPGNALYNIPIALLLSGDLNADDLEQALITLIDRHEILRSCYLSVGDTPMQQPRPADSFQMARESLQADQADAPEQLQALLDAEARAPFQLDQDLPIRARLVALPAGLSGVAEAFDTAPERFEKPCHLLLLTLHHIAGDGWSLGVLVDEMNQLYRAKRLGQPVDLPAPRFQYRDFAHWQRHTLGPLVFEEQLAYWREQLADAPPLLDLPLDFPRPATRAYRGASEPLTLDRQTTAALHAVTREEGATLFMGLLAGFAALLQRYTGEEDLVIGTDIANRNHAATESLIGFFVNQLPLRLNMADHLDFRALLRQARATTLEAYAHQDLPFDRIVAALNPRREPSYAPIFQVKLVLQNTPETEADPHGLDLTYLSTDNGANEFDLLLNLAEIDGRLQGGLFYNSEIFNPATIQRMTRHFATLLTHLVADPGRTPQQVALLDAVERRTILRDFNLTPAPYDGQSCIHEVFERHVAAHPDKIALINGDETITFGELNRQANQLAHLLIDMGVERDTIVAICMDRSARLLVAILGVLKAGAAYVPLAGDLPTDRKALILEDTAALMVLTEEAQIDSLPNVWIPVISLDGQAEMLADEADINPGLVVDPDQLAYLIFTSGSTGRPKGVMIEHRGVVNLTRWQAACYGTTPDSRVSQFASYSFDASVGESFMALLNGLTLVMLGRRLSPDALIEAVNHYRISVMVLVPSLIKELEPERLLHGDQLSVVAVGEACPPELAERWSRYTTFFNAYGPTEFTVYSHLWRIDPAALTPKAAVPIGRPIHNSKSYILDPHLNPVPIGVTGELYLCGPAIARGYHARPDLSADRFMPNPFYREVLYTSEGTLYRDGQGPQIKQLHDRFAERQTAFAPENPASPRMPVADVLALCETLDTDLAEQTRTLLQTYRDNQAVLAGFIRYFAEGINNSYASVGIDRRGLALLLGDPRGKQGVDFGFGHGEVMQTLTEMGASVRGLDLNPVFVQAARKLGFDARMAKIDAPTDQFQSESGLAPNSLDFAITTLVLDRLERPRQFLQNLFDSLKDGATFAIQTLLPIVGVDDGQVEQPIVYTPEAHQLTTGKDYRQDKAELAEVLADLGCDDLVVSHFPYLVVSRDGIQEYTAWSFRGVKQPVATTAPKPHFKRMYRTGDLARYLPDGRIEFRGRIDNQVKIRGFRIELGEIEALLLRHQAVRNAAVIVRHDEGRPQITAYIVRREGGEVDAEELRRLSADNLPEYMVPSALVFLDALPVNRSNKLDINALPAPLAGGRAEEKGYTAPRNHREALIADICGEALGHAPISVEANLFELGADSILIVQMVGRLNRAGLQLGVHHFFQYQNIAGLANVADEEPTVEANQGMVSGPVPLTPIQHWFTELDLQQRDQYSQALLLRARDKVDGDALEQAAAELVRHHDALRLRLHFDGTWIQTNAAAQTESVVTVVDLEAFANDAARHATLAALFAETRAGLNLSNGPLLRICLIREPARQQEHLFITVHHLCVDAVSWRFLLEDLLAGYQQAVTGERVHLPPKTTSFRDWALALQEYADSETLRTQDEFWNQTHPGDVFGLPRDHDGHNLATATETLSFVLDVDATRNLLQRPAALFRARVDETLLTALTGALAQQTDGRRFCFGLEHHGRPDGFMDLDLTRTVGWFTAYYPQQIKRPTGTPGDRLLAVKEQLRSVPQRGLGYGVLRYLTQDEALRTALAESPKHDISFNYLGNMDGALAEDAPFVAASDMPEPPNAETGQRDVALEIVAFVQDGRLQVDFTYCTNLHDSATIQRFRDSFGEQLDSLLDHCKDEAHARLSPADFPLAQATLARWPAERFQSLLPFEAGIEDVYPLTPLQQGILHISLDQHGEGLYFNQFLYRLQGAVDADALFAAVGETVERHPVLRTAFHWEAGGAPLQVVYRHAEPEIQRLDWRESNPAEQNHALVDLLQKDRARGFAVDQPCLMRFILIQMGAQDYRLIWDSHHLLFDGWSAARILGDVFAAYGRMQGRQQDGLTVAQSRPFRDYLVWLAKRDGRAAEKFWRKTLAGFTQATPLPPAAPRMAQHADPSFTQIRLDESHMQALQNFAAANQVTLNTLVQGAWSLVLARYSDRRDLVFGVTVSGRPLDLTGVDTMVGLFINTLPLRVSLPDDQSVAAWLQSLQQGNLAIRRFEETPLVDATRWSDVTPGTPLFQSLVVFENYHVDEAVEQLDPGFDVDQELVFEKVNYPLALYASPDQALTLQLRYDNAVYSEHDGTRLLQQVQDALVLLTEDADQPLGRIGLLSPEAQQNILTATRGAAVEKRDDQLIQGLFERQAAARGNEPAVLGAKPLSFKALDERANRWAHYLQEMGVAAETFVALFLPRDQDLVTAMLAVLKAGGAFLLLDPKNPAERNEHMVLEAEPQLLLSRGDMLDQLPDLEVPVIPMDEDEEVTLAYPVAAPSAAVLPDNAAYLFFTSGSTGRPKGVVGTHRAYLNRLHWLLAAMPFGEDEIGCHKTSLNFIDGLWEVFGPLSAGRPLLPVASEIADDPPRLVAELAKHRVTRLTLVPSLLREMLHHHPDLGARAPHLRNWICSGETLPLALLQNFTAAVPHARLMNLYGTTEVAGDVTAWTAPSKLATRENLSAVPLGQVIDGVTVTVMDDAGRLCPEQAVGEIHIGGVALARGYLNDPVQTALRFRPDPHGEPGARVYLPGDRGAWVRDQQQQWQLIFAGRSDHQIKLRGMRVELGEIEAALEQLHPESGQVAAAVIGEGETQQLVGYWVCAANAEPEVAALRAGLAKHLPSALIPQRFVFLPHLPLTVNGKLDRNSLPLPDHTDLLENPAKVPPRNALEHLLAGIWSRVLQTDVDDVHADFFMLGGHSLSATRVTGLIADQYGARLPIRSLFEHATIARLAAHLEQLSTATGIEVEPRIRPAGEAAPLSPGQERLWFIQELEGPSAAYNLPVALRLRGDLDVTALNRALHHLLERHESLRQRFPAEDGVPRVEIDPVRQRDLTPIDLAQDPDDLNTWIQREAAHPFDLAREPLFRVCLLRENENSHVLLLNQHHMISDGWSLELLVRELSESYRAFSTGQTPTTKPLPLQYGDYAYWSRHHLTARIESQRNYWLNQLADLPPALELPFDRPRAMATSQRGATLDFAINRTTTEALRQLGQEQGAGLYMVLLAGFQVLLARYSGQHRFATGMPVAGRAYPQFEDLLGFFVNTLVLDADTAGNPRFLDHLGRVRDTTLSALDHADMPFERLVDALQVSRSTQHSPLFQVLFVLQNQPLAELSLPGLTLEPLSADIEQARFDVSVTLVEGQDGLSGTFQYRTDLFDETTIVRLQNSYKRLLDAVVEAPLTAINDLPLQDATVPEQIQPQARGTARVFDGSPLHQRFEAQAAHQPTAPCLLFDGAQWDYATVNRQANQLAHLLVAEGVGVGSAVGVLLERGPHLVTALLAVLKAGAAYVPLDPEQPTQRLAHMIHGCALKHVIHNNAAAATALPDDCLALNLDALHSALQQHADTNLNCRLHGDDLAYIIHTSGSTGKPKGVMNTHRAIANRLDWMQAHFQLQSNEAVLQKTPFGFDVSVWEFFWPLMCGARLVLAAPGGHRDPNYLAHLMTATGVTTAHFVPSMLAAFLETVPTAELPPLRRVICSGEALSADLVAATARALPDTELTNLYGPTEAAVDVSLHVCHAARDAHRVPIGQPTANTELWVLDEHLRPVPTGVAGELYIGGVQLARGYAGQPALTAAAFIPHPFGSAGQRLYRTGDRVCWTSADGGETLLFLGRNDDQLKIRGFRVELGEIERVMTSNDEIGAVTVVAVAAADAPTLVAHVEGPKLEPEQHQALCAALHQQLPDYMVPQFWFYHQNLPTNRNGKRDRNALKAMGLPNQSGDAVSAAPLQTDQERQLAALWCALLDRDAFGRHAHFFQAGGHSLTATRLVARIRDQFGVVLPVRAVFETPRLADLAARIGKAEKAAAGGPITPAPSQTPPPLSFAQQRLWVLDRLEGPSATYNIPTAFRVRGALNAQAMLDAVKDVATRHHVLRARFPEVDGQARQIIDFEQDLDVVYRETTGLTAQERDQLAGKVAREQAMLPFAPTEGRLLRVCLLRFAADDHLLTVTLHHLVADGWSLGVLVDELTHLYRLHNGERLPALAPLAVQYPDYAWHQRHHGQADTALAYWRNKLAGLPPLLQLPTDRPRPKRERFVGDTLTFQIKRDLTDALNELASENEAGLATSLMTAFQVLLSRVSGSHDFAVGMPVANRNRTELEPLIGCFVNTLVLRADTAGAPSFRQLLQRVRTDMLEALDHAALPFEQLVDALAVPRSMSHAPLFQVLFVLQNTPQREPSLPGLTWENVDQTAPVAKFDMTLSLTEGPDGLFGAWEYNTDLFDRATAARFIDIYQHLLHLMVHAPDQAVTAAPLLPPPEVARFIAAAAGPQGQSWDGQSAGRLFEQQAAARPNAPALVFGEQVLSYGDLNRRANQWAHQLRAEGVGPETVVGVCLERGLEMVIALLAIHKAGAAYLPLDPKLPNARLLQMLKDAEAVVTLIDAGAPNVAWPTTCLSFVDDQTRVAAQPDTTPTVTVAGDHAAYVIFTSGSTGTPKGVVNTHGGMLNRLRWMQAMFKVTAADTLLQKTPYSFDVSVWEFFLPLMCGARLVVAKPEGHGDPHYLAEVMRRHQVDLVHFVPSMLAAFLDALDDEALPQPRALICSGEALTVETAAECARRMAHTRVHNLYGPTEAAIDVSAVCFSSTQHRHQVPIGAAVTNVVLHVLDEAGNPVPDGIAGELYIGGVQVARGYCNRPSLTAQSFVPDPFAKQAGARLYRTGDRVCRIQENDRAHFLFLGRIDGQVKLRGFRIELGEIEANLQQQPGVRTCAVTLHQDDRGRDRLAAFIVGPAEADVPALRQGLAKVLPDYMIPNLFVPLTELPLNASGKLDRRALNQFLTQAPQQTAATTAYVAPSSPTETALVELWAELLGVEKVGVHDNFFALGGDSILSIQMVSRLRERGWVLTPGQVFEFQTAATLAKVCKTVSRIHAEQGPVQGAYPATPIQNRFFQSVQRNPHHWNQSLVLETSVSIDESVLAAALQHLVDHHDVLRTTFDSDGDGVLPVIQAPRTHAAFALQQVTLATDADQNPAQQVTRIATEMQQNLDLRNGPLLRVAHLVGKGAGDKLVFVAHHLVIDGVSWRILLEDLQRFYEFGLRGQPFQPPAKTTAYAHWAEAVAQQAREGNWADEQNYWLDSARADVQPPALDHEGDNRVAEARTLHVALSRNHTETLLYRANQAYQTEINDLLLSGLLLAYTIWSGEETVLVDLEAHGRDALADSADLTRTVGWFTAIFPVLLELEGDELGRCIQNVKEQLRAVPGKGLNYGLLRYGSGPAALRDRLAAMPEAPILFNYLGQADRAAPADSLFRVSDIDAGPEHDPTQTRRHLIEINAVVRDQRLRFAITYAGACFETETMTDFAEGLLEALAEIAEHTAARDTTAFTPSDFDNTGLNQQNLDAFLAEL